MKIGMSFVTGALAALWLLAPPAVAQDGPPPDAGLQARQPSGSWQADVEGELGLGRGQGRKLMTKEEWQDHRSQMQTLEGEERERYRKEWHEMIVERARERGITMRAEPPQGRGPGTGGGPGMGGGGMGGGAGGGGRGGGMGGGTGGGRRESIRETGSNEDAARARAGGAPILIGELPDRAQPAADRAAASGASRP